jgi:Zn-dependent peptidase ImmA (M78 family)/DNA-binding XRE family transcriptional regulator
MSPKLPTSSSISSVKLLRSRKMFNPSRLTVARKRRGLTKIEFAKRMGVSLRSFKAYELGEYPPPDEILSKIVSVSDFPPEFFYGDTLEEPREDSVSFRSMARMKSYQRDMALSQGQIALHLHRWLDERFELPPVDIPSLRHERSPEAAAESLRHHWSIGELPISNMLHLLESKGVRIFSLAIDAVEVDAFSMWQEATPFIFLNSYKTAERTRYDAAHELGHLVLHRHGGPLGRKAEEQANAFASAFLMPRSSVIAHVPRFPTLTTIVKLKKIWKTSVAALTYRLHALNILSDWEYRMLYIQISKQRLRTREPNSEPRETSHILPTIFAALREDGLTRPKVAQALCIPQSELESLMFGLAIASVEGGGKGTPNRSRLTLVEKN